MGRRRFLKAIAALALLPGLAVPLRLGRGTVVRNGWILGEDDT